MRILPVFWLLIAVCPSEVRAEYPMGNWTPGYYGNQMFNNSPYSMGYNPNMPYTGYSPGMYPYGTPYGYGSSIYANPEVAQFQMALQRSQMMIANMQSRQATPATNNTANSFAKTISSSFESFSKSMAASSEAFSQAMKPIPDVPLSEGLLSTTQALGSMEKSHGSSHDVGDPLLTQVKETAETPQRLLSSTMTKPMIPNPVSKETGQESPVVYPGQRGLSKKGEKLQRHQGHDDSLPFSYRAMQHQIKDLDIAPRQKR